MKVAFRVDAALWIGSGHIMRCLTLAHALKAQEWAVTFLCAQLPGHLADLVRAAGFPCLFVPGHQKREAEQCWPDKMQTQHAHTCLAALADLPDWFIVDHYGLDISFESILAKAGTRILVIDDLNNRQHDADILLDFNLLPNYQTRYLNLVPARCQRWLGPQYALVRPIFNQLRRNMANRKGQLNHILIFFGGMDENNLTQPALEAVFKLQEKKEINVDVVLGAQNPHQQTILACCHHRANIQVHIQTPDMAQLMCKADLALGTGGSTHWERCMLCLPALICTVAPNQVLVTQALAHWGACRWLGVAESMTASTWYQAIDSLKCEDLLSMSHAGKRILSDHDGCHRVVEQLTKF